MGLPHFFRETNSSTGYGSSRRNTRLPRSLALARCLQGLLNLARHPSDLLLNIAERCLEPTGPQQWGNQLLPALQLELHVFTDGKHQLAGVLEQFRGQIHVHHLQLEDPRQLALACRDHLIAAEPVADLAVYSEDDLVIHDPLFFDKQLWFLNNTKHQSVLMPHRYELIPAGGGRRLLPDGPLKAEVIESFYKPQENVAQGRFHDGQEICFDLTTNPHAGMFCISPAQVKQLRLQPLPTEGFIGPLETAATLTVLQHFAVLKTSLSQRNFLWLEHGHHSFQPYLKSWPCRTDESAPS